jgi:hypothetical protein
MAAQASTTMPTTFHPSVTYSRRKPRRSSCLVAVGIVGFSQHVAIVCRCPGLQRRRARNSIWAAAGPREIERGRSRASNSEHRFRRSAGVSGARPRSKQTPWPP